MKKYTLIEVKKQVKNNTEFRIKVLEENIDFLTNLIKIATLQYTLKKVENEFNTKYDLRSYVINRQAELSGKERQAIDLLHRKVDGNLLYDISLTTIKEVKKVRERYVRELRKLKIKILELNNEENIENQNE